MRLVVRPEDMVWMGLILLVIINWIVNSIVRFFIRIRNKNKPT